MISLLDSNDPAAPFPPVAMAETEPDGLLAVGGDLSPTRILNAYRHGIFPWFSDGQPILWWSPNPRAVLFPSELKISRSLAKSLRNRPYRVTTDLAFEAVMRACSKPRPSQDEQGTWITGEMVAAYSHLHRLGHAHSIEVWMDGTLVGGLYGLSIGKVFFGESMFSQQRDASKIALVRLARHLESRAFGLIDCQVYSPHLGSLGARCIERAEFCRQLERHCQQPEEDDDWPLPAAP